MVAAGQCLSNDCQRFLQNEKNDTHFNQGAQKHGHVLRIHTSLLNGANSEYTNDENHGNQVQVQSQAGSPRGPCRGE